MKVTLPKDYKDIYTVNQVETAKLVIKFEREYNDNPMQVAEYMVREALEGTDDWLDRVLEVKAETARNCRVWNALDSTLETADFDIWVRVIAKTVSGYIECGAYLTDIWQSGGTPYRQHMYIDHITRKQA